jgi:hypothetical protein
MNFSSLGCKFKLKFEILNYRLSNEPSFTVFVGYVKTPHISCGDYLFASRNDYAQNWKE